MPADDWQSSPKPAKASWAHPSPQANDGSPPGTGTRHVHLSAHAFTEIVHLLTCTSVFVYSCWLLLNLHSLVLCWYVASTQFVEKLKECYEFCYEGGGTNAITLYDLYVQTRLAHFAYIYSVLSLKVRLKLLACSDTWGGFFLLKCLRLPRT